MQRSPGLMWGSVQKLAKSKLNYRLCGKLGRGSMRGCKPKWSYTSVVVYVVDFSGIISVARVLTLKAASSILNSLAVTFWSQRACYLLRVIIISVSSIQSEEKHSILCCRPQCFFGGGDQVPYKVLLESRKFGLVMKNVLLKWDPNFLLHCNWFHCFLTLWWHLPGRFFCELWGN